MKPYYRKKGKYPGGQAKIIIEWMVDGKMFTKALPKPEVMWKILDRDRLEGISKGKKGQVKPFTKRALNDHNKQEDLK